ncbi:hypothetical protein [Niveispirillum sp. KHB5.9]|uniref:hypothetical protein n=1 Tax=Niveispirillum sp. KHB5.9 TaxID=3400269 RepID=UPI003A8A3B05
MGLGSVSQGQAAAEAKVDAMAPKDGGGAWNGGSQQRYGLCQGCHVVPRALSAATAAAAAATVTFRQIDKADAGRARCREQPLQPLQQPLGRKCLGTIVNGTDNRSIGLCAEHSMLRQQQEVSGITSELDELRLHLSRTFTVGIQAIQAGLNTAVLALWQIPHKCGIINDEENHAG